MNDLFHVSAIAGTVGSIWAGREILVHDIAWRRRATLTGIAVLCYGTAIASFIALNGVWDPRTQIFMVGIPLHVAGHRLLEIYNQRTGESHVTDEVS